MRLKIINVTVSGIIAIICILFISLCIYTDAQAQTTISFSPQDQFSIPTYNGSVNFAVNGSYSQATLENDSWTFQNLSMNRSTMLNTFRVSAQNCNITIFSYVASNTTQTLRLRYAVTGSGKQIFYFGQIPGVQNTINWYVDSTINGKTLFLTPGVDWTISRNGTVDINAATGNFSTVRFSTFNPISMNSNLPFYEQHSIALTTSAVVAIVLVLAVVITLRNRAYLTEKKAGNSTSAIIRTISLKDAEKI